MFRVLSSGDKLCLRKGCRQRGKILQKKNKRVWEILLQSSDEENTSDLLLSKQRQMVSHPRLCYVPFWHHRSTTATTSTVKAGIPSSFKEL